MVCLTSLLPLLPLFASSVHAAPKPRHEPASGEMVKRKMECNTGAYIIYARDFFENNGNSALLEVARLVSDAIPDSRTVPVEYPAAEFKRGPWDRRFQQDDFYRSRNQGVSYAYDLIDHYNDDCILDNNSKPRIVLLGFGSGATVMTQLLIDWNDRNPAKEGVIAVATFGDPTHVGDRPYNAGSTARSGVEPRWPDGTLKGLRVGIETYFRDFCEWGDPFCDGGDRWEQHNDGVRQRARQAADFIIDKVRNGPFPKRVDC